MNSLSSFLSLQYPHRPFLLLSECHAIALIFFSSFLALLISFSLYDDISLLLSHLALSFALSFQLYLDNSWLGPFGSSCSPLIRFQLSCTCLFPLLHFDSSRLSHSSYRRHSPDQPVELVTLPNLRSQSGKVLTSLLWCFVASNQLHDSSRLLMQYITDEFPNTSSVYAPSHPLPPVLPPHLSLLELTNTSIQSSTSTTSFSPRTDKHLDQKFYFSWFTSVD